MRLFRGIKNCYSLEALSGYTGGSITMNDLSHIENAVLIEVSGRIHWIGSEAEFNSQRQSLGVPENVQTIDLGCETLLPGFVECHTHLVFGGDRSEEFELRNQGVSYQEISKRGGGILSTVKATRSLKKDELQQLAQQRANDFVAQGVTALEVKSGYGLSHESEIKMLEVAAGLDGPKVVKTYLGPHSIPPEKSKQEYLDEVIEKTLPEVAARGLADRADIFIEGGFFTAEDGRRFFEKARQVGLKITGHVEQLSHSGGAELCVELGVNSADHLVEISDDDVARLAGQSSTVSVLLPTADFYLKMSYPPARKLIDAGAAVALATDFNPGSSPSQSLNFVGVLARLQMNMTLPEVIAGYTINAARALALHEERGTLSVGKACDFVCFSEPLEALFYQVGSHKVLATYRNGQEIWKNRNLTN